MSRSVSTMSEIQGILSPSHIQYIPTNMYLALFCLSPWVEYLQKGCPCILPHKAFSLKKITPEKSRKTNMDMTNETLRLKTMHRGAWRPGAMERRTELNLKPSRCSLVISHLDGSNNRKHTLTVQLQYTWPHPNR